MTDTEEEKAADSTGKNEETTNQEDTSKSVKKEKKRYVFNCTKCGKCCKDRTSVPVTIRDIETWTKKGMITALLPHLSVEFIPVKGSQGQFVQLVMKKQPTGEGGEAITGCPMFDEENSICNIYHSMPVDCSAYPLGFNGKIFFIRDKTCEGIGNGTMTKERLINDRNLAEEDYNAKVSSNTVFPILTSLLNKFFMQELLEQQKRLRKNLSDEEKAKLDDIDKILKNKTSEEPPAEENQSESNTGK
ncbi:MAG: YkgJ family cysteine cluster protein [Candidatus Hodarchaeales archaeon]